MFFLHWGQKEMLLPKLHKETFSSKEQANTIPKQKELTKGMGEFPDQMCLHADDVKKWHTGPRLPRRDFALEQCSQHWTGRGWELNNNKNPSTIEESM